MAKKSDNPTNALINRNFIIRVLENPKVNDVKNTKLTSANKLSKYLLDEEIKIKLFKKILDEGKDKYTFLIRSRLKIDFQSK
ncbi:hypothetical protein BC749_108167 [Flavobacterium araucananum]|uniref:Uncharacterized protein n=1 Tax=Flavobacterium araucananum TaxID=946678 RepID=A0A227NQV7_9FLAO|nr:hypothetical protein [Flavobacterium araucananum]OXG00001.1 hypothetical protein B0A64_20800 [Flavobacterium araucananum]PWJ97017.1 hypothetical protein BC749_108167 [Flavobacterium araucananum]